MIITPKTKGLLREAIEHWRRHENGTAGSDEGIQSKDCPLCEVFLNRGLGTCCGCPVREFRGRDFCEGTPWRDAADAYCSLKLNENPLQRDKRELDFKRAAKRMRCFLEHILMEADA